MSQESNNEYSRAHLKNAIRDRLRLIDFSSSSDELLVAEISLLRIQALQAFLVSQAQLQGLLTYYFNTALIALAGLSGCREKVVNVLRDRKDSNLSELPAPREVLQKHGLLGSHSPEDAIVFLLNEKDQKLDLILQLVFCAQYETFEVYLCDLFSIFAYCVPHAWDGREAIDHKAISTRDLASAESLADLRLALAERKASAFVRSANVHGMLTTFSSKLKEELNLAAEDLRALRQYSAMRNCFVHNRGIADRSYVETLKQIGVSPVPTIGEVVKVTDKFEGNTQNVYSRIAIELDSRAENACVRLVKHNRQLSMG